MATISFDEFTKGKKATVIGNEVDTGFKKQALAPKMEAPVEQPASNSFMGFKQGKESIPAKIISGTWEDYKQAIPRFMEAAQSGKSKAGDLDSRGQPIDETTAMMRNIATGSLASTASGIGTVFAPISQTIQTLADSFAETPVGEKIISSEKGGKVLDKWDKFSNWLTKIEQEHPEAASNIKNALTIALTATGEKPVTKTSKAISAEGKALLSDTTGLAKYELGKAKTFTKETVPKIKEKLAPTQTAESITGDILQPLRGETAVIESGKTALSKLDTSKVKTYKDLKDLSETTIKEKAKLQDINLSKDTTPRPLETFTKTIGEGDNAVKINYVEQALDNLKELYVNTSDMQGLSKLNSYLKKVEETGLTVKEINDIARMYGSEFGTKAFGKTGEALTSVNATKFENIRSGVKETAREFLPDEASRKLDAEMADLYTVKDLSAKMEGKVNTLTQRLQKPNILQKLGAIAGKYARVSGVGDFAQKLLGIEKIPGAKTLDAVELQGQLSTNLRRLEEALKKDDAGFVKDVKQIMIDNGFTPQSKTGKMIKGFVEEPKAGLSVKNIGSESVKKFIATKPEYGLLKDIETYIDVARKVKEAPYKNFMSDVVEQLEKRNIPLPKNQQGLIKFFEDVLNQTEYWKSVKDAK